MAITDNLGVELVKPLGPSVWKVQALTGTEAISEPYRFELEMLAETGREVSFADVLGQTATIRLAGGQRLIHGLVSQLSVGSALFTGDNVAPTVPYRVVVVPQLWKLGLKRNCASFRDASSLDIAKQLLQGLDVQVNLPSPPAKRSYVVQHRETDLAFLQRLLAEDGIFFFFQQTDDHEQLVLADGNDAFVKLAGVNQPDSSQLPFRGREAYDPDAPHQVFSWQLGQRLTAGSVAAGDYHFQLSDQGLGVTSNLAAPVTVGKQSYEFRNDVNQPIERFSFPGKYAGWMDAIKADKSEPGLDGPAVRDRGKQVISRAAERLASGALRGNGESNCFALSCGTKFLLDHPSDGDWFAVLRIDHRAVPEEGAEGPAAPVYSNRFEAAPVKAPYRPPEIPAPIVSGLQTAVVTGPAKSDIFTEKYGRVQLQFHWDRKAPRGLTNESKQTLRASNYWTGANPATVPPWARATQGWAGPGYGALILPRLGHEVVAGFVSGDPASPTVLNSLYNSVTGTPLPMPEAAKFFAHKTRTVGSNDTNHFHGLGIQDTKGAEHVQLQSQKDLLFSTEKDHLTAVGSLLHQRFNKGNLLTVGSNPLAALTGGSGSGGDGGSFGKWTVDNVTASLSYGFNIVYGEYCKAVGPLYGGLAIGTKTDIYCNPLYLLGNNIPVVGGLAAGLKATIPVRLEFLMTTKSDFILGTRSSLLLNEKEEIKLEGNAAVTALSRALAAISTVEFLALGIAGPDYFSANAMSITTSAAGILTGAAFVCLWVTIIACQIAKLAEAAADKLKIAMTIIGVPTMLTTGLIIVALVAALVAMLVALVWWGLAALASSTGLFSVPMPSWFFGS